MMAVTFILVLIAAAVAATHVSNIPNKHDSLSNTDTTHDHGGENDSIEKSKSINDIYSSTRKGKNIHIIRPHRHPHHHLGHSSYNWHDDDVLSSSGRRGKRRGGYGASDTCYSSGKSCGANNDGVCRPISCLHGEHKCEDRTNPCLGLNCHCCKPGVHTTTSAPGATSPTSVSLIEPEPTNTSNPGTTTPPMLTPEPTTTSDPGTTTPPILPYEATTTSDPGTTTPPILPYAGTCLLLGKSCGVSNSAVCRATACIAGETESYDTFCSGPNCHCCASAITVPTSTYGPIVPPAATCLLLGKSCGSSNNGLCRATACNAGETENYDSFCSGSNCHCCVSVVTEPTTTSGPVTTTIPIVPPAMCLSLGKTCGASNNGVCRANACNVGEIDSYDHICSGPNCHCCVSTVTDPPFCNHIHRDDCADTYIKTRCTRLCDAPTTTSGPVTTTTPIVTTVCVDGISWKQDCNDCICFNGQPVCTLRVCPPRPLYQDPTTAYGFRTTTPTVPSVPETTTPPVVPSAMCPLLGQSCGPSNNGVCRATTCNAGETESYDTSCSGYVCHCCVSRITGFITTSGPSPITTYVPSPISTYVPSPITTYVPSLINTYGTSPITTEIPALCPLLGKSCGPSNNGVCRATTCSAGETESYDSSCSGYVCHCCVSGITGSITTSDPGPITTSDPGPVTTFSPVPITTSDPGPITAYSPVSITTSDPGPITAYSPVSITTSDPGPITTSDPGPVTTSIPVPISTTDLGPMTTYGPSHITTSDPVPITAYSPVPITTSDPGLITASSPVPISTTDPGFITTSTPGPITTSTPGPITTSAPGPITTSTPGPITSSAPGPITTSTPGPITTSAPGPISIGGIAMCPLFGKSCGPNNNGVCRATACIAGETESYDNSCSGYFCHCCVSGITGSITTSHPDTNVRYAPFPITTEGPAMCPLLGKSCGLSNNGMCRALPCNAGETEIYGSSCSGYVCHCCVSGITGPDDTTITPVTTQTPPKCIIGPQGIMQLLKCYKAKGWVTMNLTLGENGNSTACGGVK